MLSPVDVIFIYVYCFQQPTLLKNIIIIYKVFSHCLKCCQIQMWIFFLMGCVGFCVCLLLGGFFGGGGGGGGYVHF